MKEFFQRGDDELLALVHTKRRGLENQDVLVFIDDETAKQIAFRVHDTKGCCAGHVLLADGQSGGNAVVEELLVQFDAVRGQNPKDDLGARVVNAGAEESLPMILYLDQASIGDFLRDAENGSMINPGMTRDDAVGVAGLENDCRQ